MMDVSTATYPQRITDAIWFTIYVGIALVVFFVLSHREVDGGLTRWQRWRDAFTDRYLTSSVESEEEADNDQADAQKGALSLEKRNGEMGEMGVATGKTEGNDPFQFPDLFTGLARLVLSEKLGETDALKIAVKASPGKSPRYIEARSRLHAAMERERPPDGPRFVVYDDAGLATFDAHGQVVTTMGRQSSP